MGCAINKTLETIMAVGSGRWRKPVSGEGATVVGCAVDSGEEVGIPLEARFLGLYVIGGTGTGKTTLIENMVAQDMEAAPRRCPRRLCRQGTKSNKYEEGPTASSPSAAPPRQKPDSEGHEQHQCRAEEEGVHGASDREKEEGEDQRADDASKRGDSQEHAADPTRARGIANEKAD